MDNFTSPQPPHPDVSEALADDLRRIMNYEHEPPLSIGEVILRDHWLSYTARSLVEVVGSIDRLEQLDTTPHPLEPLDPDGLSVEELDRAGELLHHIERAELELDDEFVTIIRRVVRQLTVHPDHPLVRKASAERMAAGIAWVALTASRAIGPRTRKRIGDLWVEFGVSSCTDLGQTFATALRHENLELEPDLVHWHRDRSTVVADPTLLHSSFRRDLIDQRNDLKRRIRSEQQATMQYHPIQIDVAGMARFSSQPTTVRWAMRANDEAGRATVMISLGGLEAMQLLSVSVPDARRLIAALEHALAQPLIELAG